MSAEGRRLGIVLGVVFGLFAAMVYLYAPLVMEVDRPLAVVAIPAALSSRSWRSRCLSRRLR